MEELRFEKLTVGLIVKREGGMFKSSGLGVFYDPNIKEEKPEPGASYGEYEPETIYGKYSRIGGMHKYPNVDPGVIAELFYETMNIAGIAAEKPVYRPLRLDLEGNLGYLVRFPLEDLERGRSIYEFLSTMFYGHRNALQSFIYLDKAKKKDLGQTAVITLGPDVKTLSTERFQPIYIGGTQQQDSIVVDKSVCALNFYSVQRSQIRQFLDRIESRHMTFSITLDGLPADQVAYTHSVMWDNKDLPRGYRANLIRRGLIGQKEKNTDKLVAYSLFPMEMETRLVESLRFIQKLIEEPTDLLQRYLDVNSLIKQVVKDEFYFDL